jgi:hypothetical protein
LLAHPFQAIGMPHRSLLWSNHVSQTNVSCASVSFKKKMAAACTVFTLKYKSGGIFILLLVALAGHDHEVALVMVPIEFLNF